MRHPGSVQGHRNYLAEMPSVTTSGSGALRMLPLTVSGQPREISLERLGQPMSLYVPLSKGTRASKNPLSRVPTMTLVRLGRAGSWRPDRP